MKKNLNLVLFWGAGKGSFGFVTLVRNKNDSSAIYALKGVSKVQIQDLGQQEHIISEKNAMVRFDHPFLVKLYATFKDANAVRRGFFFSVLCGEIEVFESLPLQLYFLLEPCLGGELFTLLRSRTSFNEKVSKFYAACVGKKKRSVFDSDFIRVPVLAFEYMHQSDTLYRDLKPENLLLDKDGYIKVTDFGFAKVCFIFPARLPALRERIALFIFSGGDRSHVDTVRHTRLLGTRGCGRTGTRQGCRLVDIGRADLRNAGQVFFSGSTFRLL